MCVRVKYPILAPRSDRVVQADRFVRFCIISTFRYPHLTFYRFVYSSESSTTLSLGARAYAVESLVSLNLFRGMLAYERNCRSGLFEEPEREVFWFLIKVNGPTCRILSNLNQVKLHLYRCDPAHSLAFRCHHFFHNLNAAFYCLDV